MKNIRKPNFFIVGAPKSGTTAMSEYLRTHPNIYLSNPKEPGFFSKDIFKPLFQSEEEYLSLFAAANSNHTYIGEGSVHYLYSKEALPKIRSFNPEARIIVMLRNPINMAHAWHSEMVYGGIESVLDFEYAWSIQTDREQGRKLPKYSSYSSSLLLYKKVCQIGSQVKVLLDIFPRNQIHFILFDDFISDTNKEYQKLLRFLNLPDDNRVEFPLINENRGYKWPRLAISLRAIKRYFYTPLYNLRRLKKLTGRGVETGTGLLRMVDKFIIIKGGRLPLRPEFHQYLQCEFRDEILLLQDLLGWRLDKWLENKTK
ncbi:sulfotransferase family protein [Candidatus Nitrosacidococcus tergens]|uniref:Sulfotransferase n=1 Tax=Candidatus Nitrosacidococcus tergens TaxID=553981 RepID=A0A7G1QA71_9GAMM|nr:sulfotransferase [Candidatus Nitrosacidococcus tergens]CAB1275809.1 Sulfotransferase [Candidatus Nitrosacidococcus tergens]